MPALPNPHSTRTRVCLDGGDFKPGNPEHRVVGRMERPAREHGPLPPKPPAGEVGFEDRLRRQLEARIVEARRYAAEVPRLEVALAVYRQGASVER